MIVIDPSKGGRESGVTGNGIVEKDYNLLISEYIFNKLKSLGADVKIIRTTDEYISEDDRANKILNAYGNNSKVVALSNMLGNTGSGAEIIYALRNNSTLSKKILNELEKEGQNVRKYYQQRLPSNPIKDYYFMQRNTPNNETITVEYGFIDSPKDKKTIEEYLYKIVNDRVNEFIISNIDQELLFLEIPLLFQAKCDEYCDKIVLLTIDENIQKERLLKRNGQYESYLRINQSFYEQLDKNKIDYVIDNSSTVNNLNKKIKSLICDIKKHQ